MYGRVKRPEVMLRKQTRGWSRWRIALFILGLSRLEFAYALHHHPNRASASRRPNSSVGLENNFRCARDTRRSGDHTLREGPMSV